MRIIMSTVLFLCCIVLFFYRSKVVPFFWKPDILLINRLDFSIRKVLMKCTFCNMQSILYQSLSSTDWRKEAETKFMMFYEKRLYRQSHNIRKWMTSKHINKLLFKEKIIILSALFVLVLSWFWLFLGKLWLVISLYTIYIITEFSKKYDFINIKLLKIF